MAGIIYESGPDYNLDNPVMWREEGEIPPCVEPFRLGDFICQCGKHRVQAYITIDPLDSQDRISRIVTLI
jgi:hypothetical protein